MPDNGLIIPEVIQGTNLVAPANDNFFEVDPGALPNGEDALIMRGTQGRAAMWQPALTGVHKFADGFAGASVNWTLNMWLKLTDISGSGQGSASMSNMFLTICGKDFAGDYQATGNQGDFSDGGNAGGVWGMSVDGGRIIYTAPEWGDDKFQTKYVTMPDTDWHMFTMIVNGNGFTAYLDQSILGHSTLTNQGGASGSKSTEANDVGKRFGFGAITTNPAHDCPNQDIHFGKVILDLDNQWTQQDVTDLYLAMTT
jgi:hypothetical protein